VREGSPAGNEGMYRRLMSSGVPFSGGPSEVIGDEAAAEERPRDSVMSSPGGGRSASGSLAGDGGADSYT